MQGGWMPKQVLRTETTGWEVASTPDDSQAVTSAGVAKDAEPHALL
jgi:hypothetical protein